MMPDLKILAVAAAAVFTASAAHAATVNVGGTGFFGPNAPTTAESAPGQTFVFSFVAETPISGDFDSSLVSSSYKLAGNDTVPTITTVTYFNTGDSGLFDLTFSDDTVLSLYGAPIEMGGYLQSGYYQAAIGIAGGDPIGVGGVSVSVNVSPVPLPASAPLYGGALLILAASGIVLKRVRYARPIS